jgi:PPOX class probable F420-dependent enzyme
MLDFSSKFGRRVAQQLESESIIWLTTLGPDNTPQPRPVWFLWDGKSLLVYSNPKAHKVRHIGGNPKVSLNFNSDPEAHGVTVLIGDARIDSSAPPADINQEYLEKYHQGIANLGMTPSEFASEYSVSITVIPQSMRGF